MSECENNRPLTVGDRVRLTGFYSVECGRIVAKTVGGNYIVRILDNLFVMSDAELLLDTREQEPIDDLRPAEPN